MIEQGFIEVVTGVGKNSRSVTTEFRDREPADVATWVNSLSGATISNTIPAEMKDRNGVMQPVPSERCLGFWSGTNAEGKQATIRVWITDPD